MPIRNSMPMPFTPTGLSDGVDQASTFNGSCQSLTNFIFDRQTRGVIIPRPGAVSVTNFSGFNTPGIISLLFSVGSKIYGLISSNRNIGYDEPFCYDTFTNAFITVSNVTPSNVPVTQISTGPWVPPTADIIGAKVIVTHPGFSAPNYFGYFDISGFNLTETSTASLGLLAAATYYYVITAVNGNGQTVKSNEISIVSSANSSNLISWSAINGASGYNVWRGTSAGGENLYIALGPVTLYTDNATITTSGSLPVSNSTILSAPFTSGSRGAAGGGFKSGVWYFVVTAINQNGETIAGNEILISAPNYAPGYYFNISWNSQPGATSYRVYQGTNPGGENFYINVNANTQQIQIYFGQIVLSGTPPLTNTTGLSSPVLNSVVSQGGSNVLTALASTTGVYPGMVLSGSKVSLGTQVVSTTSTTITMTNPVTSTGTFLLTITGGSQSAPLWNSGNTFTNALPSVPIWVAQFFGRAYYGCGPYVVFSDVLNPLNISNTNFSSALTLGDTTNTICAAGLPFNNSASGILQSLIVFKSNAIYQIQGDVTGTGSTALSLNNISSNIGCLMPRTAISTQYGVLFIANDGPRLMDLSGTLQYLKTGNEILPDIVSPFTNATTPSRACASYNNGIYRVALDTNYQTNSASGNITYAADYWYDFLFQRWNGPHTFQYHAVDTVDGTFYTTSNFIPAMIFKCDVVQNNLTVYSDNLVNYNSSFVSCTMPPASPMSEKCIVESTIELSNSTSPINYSITIYDDLYNSLNSINFTPPLFGTIWGNFIWGSSKWNSPYITTHSYTIPWTTPIVFKKMILTVSLVAQNNVAIREIDMRYQELGYTNK